MPILNDIIDWVENKPEFWQVAIDKLIRNNNLTDSDISELKEICKTNVGLSDFAFRPVDFDALRNFALSTTSCDSITISKVHNVENINALASTNILEFSPLGLTVVYGDNGAGKSSYVGILKHVCNTRGNKPKIIGNLYSPTTYNNDKKAEVEFSKDGTNFESVSLVNGVVNNLTLKSVDVFDANSANHYIENEDEIAFIPQGLSIIEKFASGIKKIEEALNAELQSRSLVKFDYLTLIEIPENSNSKAFLKTLNSQTTRAELRAKSEWNKTKDDRLTKLIDLIQKLKATDPKKELKSNEDKIARFKILKNKFKALEDILCGDSLGNLKDVINEYVNANQALKDSSEKVFSNLPLNGIGNQTWQILWESARKFYNESKEEEVFPETEGNCPLCLQELNTEAKLRFYSFEEFVKNDIQQRCNLANEKFNLQFNKVNALSFDFQEQNPIVAELNEISLDYSTNQEKYIETLKSQKEYLLGLFNAKQVIDTINDTEIESNSRITIENLITDLESSNEKLKT
ncbi:AAA family ATPase [Draconibacterium sediminis]|uniref:AAA family ATPase n=1 Tax=Draconibacterium sediminis TaxID=1544798 RepID=UPI0026EC823C|nr:AAA family ATPase [Draconibacterium sediminis]